MDISEAYTLLDELYNSNNKKYYHTSFKLFDKFDSKYIAKLGYLGRGFYFTDYIEEKLKATYLYEVSLNITNPIIVEEDNTELIIKLLQYVNMDYNTFKEKTNYMNPKNYAYDFIKLYPLFYRNKLDLNNILKNLGYDAVILNTGYKQLIVFDENQITINKVIPWKDIYKY